MATWTKQQHPSVPFRRKLLAGPAGLVGLACIAVGLPAGAQLERLHAGAEPEAAAEHRARLEATIDDELDYQSKLLRNSRGEGSPEASEDDLQRVASPR